MRAPTLALLALLLPALSQAQADGGVPDELFIIQVKEAGVITPQGHLFEVDGGLYMDEHAAVTIAQELAFLRTENDSLKKTPVLVQTPTTPIGILVSLAVGLLLGAGGAFYVLRK